MNQIIDKARIVFLVVVGNDKTLHNINIDIVFSMHIQFLMSVSKLCTSY
jgi:hypothetical protein